ncbi:50S ribosomal protein P1 [Candidatus Woesearchaeota archaeon]|nr:50S ribosomal protein P1 [Candidatus Woesearchaeota archaeon]
MEYIYAAMLLHKAGQKVDEASVKKVLEAAHVKVDDTRAKALVAALEGVNIDEAIEKAAMPVAVAAPAAEHKAEAKVDHAKKAAEEKKSEEQAAMGLGALFG